MWTFPPDHIERLREAAIACYVLFDDGFSRLFQRRASRLLPSEHLSRHRIFGTLFVDGGLQLFGGGVGVRRRRLSRRAEALELLAERRCLLGRALVHQPQTLILDEPTEGLDFAASFDYLDRIRVLARSGHNIVLVTHHLNEIPPEVERVVVLKDGNVVADGDKASVLDSEFLGSVYETAIRVTEVDGFYLAYPGSRLNKT